MPSVTLFDSVYYPRAMITCHALHRPTMCVKCYTDMQLSMSFAHVCFKRDIMSCHSSCHPTVCVVQGLWWPTTSEVVLLCVLSKGYNGMQRPTSSDCVSCQRECRNAMPDFVSSFVFSKGDNFLPCRTPSVRVCSPRLMMAFNVRDHPTVCSV